MRSYRYCSKFPISAINSLRPSDAYMRRKTNQIQTFSLKKMRLKMSSAKCCAFCLGHSMLILLLLKPEYSRITRSINSIVVDDQAPSVSMPSAHDDVIKWKHFPRNWPFVREIHRSPVNFPHKGQWRGALMFSLIYAWINDWVNNREAGDLRRQHGHYDVIVMQLW